MFVCVCELDLACHQRRQTIHNFRFRFHYVATTSELTVSAKPFTCPFQLLLVFLLSYLPTCVCVYSIVGGASFGSFYTTTTTAEQFFFVCLPLFCLNVFVCVCWIPYWRLCELVRCGSEVLGTNQFCQSAVELLS